MAKAEAKCTCKYCGKEFEYVAYKVNSRAACDFEKWAAENIDECPECRDRRHAEERAEASRVAAEAAKAKAWPELTGTEKQVAWANRIREISLGAIVEKAERMKKYPEAYELAGKAIKVMLDHTSASWWIDNRSNLERSFERIAAAIEENPQKYAQAEEPSEPDEATIAKPEDQTHSGVVDIKASDVCVSAVYPKDDDFRKTVKALGYRWNGGKSAWQLRVSFSTGSASERAAELGNKLLNAGFAVRIQDPDTLKNAIEGNYEPMTYRWISKNSLTGNFTISWGREDDLYAQAKRLPGARYVSPNIQVPAKEWISVADFAETYDFKFSPGAQELISRMQGSTTIVRPAAGKDASYDERPLQDVLSSSREILDDLKDN